MGIKSSKSNIIIEEETCAICMENVKKDGKQTIMLNCNHFYHKPCIDNWLINKNICPYCIQPVENYKPNIAKPDTQLYVTTKKDQIYIVHNKKMGKNHLYTCLQKCKKICTYNKYNRCYESTIVSFTMFVLMLFFANAIFMPMAIKFINEKYDIVLNPEHYNTQSHDGIHTIETNYTDVNYTDVNYTDVNYTDVNYTDVNYTILTNLFGTNSSINNFTCVDTNKDSHIDYNYVFINSTPDIVIQICYTIFIFVIIMSIHIKYKTVFFAVTYLPFIGWYTFTIHRYIQIFYYLNKMKDVTYCQDISQYIYGYEITGKVFLSLLTICTAFYIMLLTRENIVRHMRVDTNTV